MKTNTTMPVIIAFLLFGCLRTALGIDPVMIDRDELRAKEDKWSEVARENSVLKRENKRIEATSKTVTERNDALEKESRQLTLRNRDLEEALKYLLYEEPRVWTSKSGKKMAALLLVSDEDQVTLQKTSGEQMKIKKTQLTDKDRNCLKLVNVTFEPTADFDAEEVEDVEGF